MLIFALMQKQHLEFRRENFLKFLSSLPKCQTYAGNTFGHLCVHVKVRLKERGKKIGKLIMTILHVIELLASRNLTQIS